MQHLSRTLELVNDGARLPLFTAEFPDYLAANTVALRDRADGSETRDLSLDAVIEKLKAEIESKAIRAGVTTYTLQYD